MKAYFRTFVHIFRELKNIFSNWHYVFFKKDSYNLSYVLEFYLGVLPVGNTLLTSRFGINFKLGIIR